MRVSLGWLQDYVDVSLRPEELADRLTMAGLEVSAVERVGEGVEDVVVGQVLRVGQHPNADRLRLCQVSDGAETFDIVCGATNMRDGDKVALARVGTVLPGGLKIKKAKIRGQESSGMMCSERELGLGEDHSGIIILPPDSPLGTPLVEVLGLPDTVLEVELTPNRPDCLSIVGVAREVAALTGEGLRVPLPEVPETGDPIADQTSIEIVDADLCHRYAARIIRGVRLAPSPPWLQQRLRAHGVRPINNVVDVTNYVLLELGHPLHAFDLRRLEEERIVVKRAAAGETFTTLDGQDRVLTADSLLICDGKRGVALAGIMGGLNSEVQDDTTDILLESAYFQPENIRRTSKTLGLSTEASYRFERGTDVDGLMLALDRAAQLMAELADGKVARGVWDAYPTRHEPVQATLRLAKVAAVLGKEVSQDAVAAHLAALGMPITGREEGQLVVGIPSHRVDLQREIDLIEEVARMEGYDSIPTTLPTVPMVSEPIPEGMLVGDKVRGALRAAGMQEAITYSFVDREDDGRLALPEDSPLRDKVALANPLSRETEVLRASLLPGLLRSASLNLRRQVRDVRLFEVGRTFHPEPGQDLPREVLRAGGILAGRRLPLAWWADAGAVDFFDAKGAVEMLFEELVVGEDVRFASVADIPWLHPGRAARVHAGDATLGWVGQVHPDRAEAFEIDVACYAFEVDLQQAWALRAGPGRYRGLAKFPAVERDLAVLLDRTVPVQAALDTIRSLESSLVRSVVLFDVFEGDRIPAGKVSLAIRVTYRADDRTLTEEEVGEVEQRILGRLAESVGAKLRES